MIFVKKGLFSKTMLDYLTIGDYSYFEGECKSMKPAEAYRHNSS